LLCSGFLIFLGFGRVGAKRQRRRAAHFNLFAKRQQKGFTFASLTQDMRFNIRSLHVVFTVSLREGLRGNPFVRYEQKIGAKARRRLAY
jgi:hypothetical protein